MKGDLVTPTLMQQRARALRRAMTPAEMVLWRALRSRTLGHKVRRQVPLGPYILDFVVVAVRLVIEVDGETHATAGGIPRDKTRDTWLAAQGWRVLRFTNADVTANPDGVLTTIVQHATA